MKDNIFQIRKEKKVSRFLQPTLIVEKDRGPKTSKRFLIDELGCKILNLNSGGSLGFIFDDGSGWMIIVNLSEVNKVELGISEEDVQEVSKSKVLFSEDNVNYKYLTFNSKELFNRLMEEYELSSNVHNSFSMKILPDNENFTEIRNYLESIGIKDYFLLEYSGKIFSKSELEAKNSAPKWYSGGMDPYEVYEKLKEQMPNFANDINVTPIEKKTRRTIIPGTKVTSVPADYSDFGEETP